MEEEPLEGAETASFGQIVAPPTSDQIDALLAAVSKAPVEGTEATMHLAYIGGDGVLSLENIDQAMKLIASRWSPFTSKVIDIRKVLDAQDNFICVCAVIDSTGLEDLRREIVTAMVEESVDVESSDEVAFHIPLSTSDEAGAIDAAAIINMELSFDELTVIINGDEINSYILGSELGLEAYYISQSHTECDGYAVVRSEDDALVECFDNEADARAELDRLLNAEGDRQDEKLISLENQMTDTFETTDVAEENSDAVAEGPVESDEIVLATEDVRADTETTEPLDEALSIDAEELQDTTEDPIVEEVDPLRAGALAQSRIASTRSTEFEGVLLVEGLPTGDRRFIEPGSLSWRDLPLPLMFTDARTEGHAGSRIAGVITELWREEVGDLSLVWGRGHFDRGAVGTEAMRMLSEGSIRGVSADLDSITIAEQFDEDNPEDYMLILTGGRVMGATLLPFPAFQEASIWVVHNNEVDPALVASGAEVYNPKLSILTEIAVGENN